MKPVSPIIDAHCHFANRSMADARILAEAGIIPVNQAMLPVEPRRAETLLDMFDHLLARYVGKDIKGTGVTAYTGLGIHPRSSHFKEKQNYQRVFDALPEYLAHPFVVCVGEIGLDKIDETERMVLRRQLEIAKDVGKPCVIHTPGTLKAEGLDATLDILREVDMPPGLVVLDHITPDLVDTALSYGGLVGLTVKKNKLGVDAVVEILRAHTADIPRFIVNSDVGFSASTNEELTMVRTASDGIQDALGINVAAKVCRNNAAQLFQIPVGVLEPKGDYPPRLKN